MGTEGERENMKNNFIKLSPLVRYSLIIETLKIVQQNFPCILSFLFVLSPSAASLTPSVLHTYCTYVTCSVISVTFYVKLNKKKKFCLVENHLWLFVSKATHCWWCCCRLLTLMALLHFLALYEMCLSDTALKLFVSSSI